MGLVRHAPAPNPTVQSVAISKRGGGWESTLYTPAGAQEHKKGAAWPRGSSPAGTVGAQDGEGCQRPPTAFVICRQVLSRKVTALALKELV